LDNDNDNIYDVIFVKQFDTYVIDAVDIENNIIYDRYGRQITIDENLGNQFVTIIKDEEQVKLRALKKGDVLSLIISEDRTVFYGTVSNKTVSGNVDEINDDSIIIGGQEYKTSTLYKNLNHAYAPDIKVNMEGKFYLNEQDEISAVDLKYIGTKNYAYMFEAASIGGMSRIYKIKVLDSDNIEKILKTAEKIKWNGQMKYADEVMETIKTGGDIKQIITYNLNEDGEVIELNTPMATTGLPQSNPLEYAGDVGNFSDVENKGEKYYGGILTFQNTIYTINKNTTVFIISTGGISYSYTTTNSYFIDYSKSYKCRVYNCDESGMAEAIVVYTDDQASNVKPSASNVPMIITSITDVSDGAYEGKRIKGLSRDGEITLKVDDDETLNATVKGLHIGDIIQYNVNKEAITAILRLFDITTRETSANKISDDPDNSNSFFNELAAYYGTVQKAVGNAMFLHVDPNASEITVTKFILDSGTKYFKIRYNNGNVKVSTATQQDIVKNKRVFVRIRYQKAHEVVIVEN
jgi:hypothetical protein